MPPYCTTAVRRKKWSASCARHHRNIGRNSMNSPLPSSDAPAVFPTPLVGRAGGHAARFARIGGGPGSPLPRLLVSAYAYVRRCGQRPTTRRTSPRSFLPPPRQTLARLRRPAKRAGCGLFLITALKNFMRQRKWRPRSANAARRPGAHATRHRVRRKAGSRPRPIRPMRAPDECFDRQWALTLLDLTVNRLRAEFAGRANRVV